MEIKGVIKSKHVDQIRLVTSDKNQEVDIFFTESKKFDVEELTERETVILAVTMQSVDFHSLKLGKLWLKEIVSPKKPKRQTSHKGKGGGTVNWGLSRQSLTE